MFDNFTYQYQKVGGKTVSNRLYHVNDDINITNIMTDDIDDEGVFSETNINNTNNYGYDEIGNLKFDKAEGIDKIEWTAYGKVRSITRLNSYFKTVNGVEIYPSNLEFRYDATGNRIAKIEKPRDANGEKSAADWKTTYYVRDATGNPMGTYQQSAPSEEASFKLIERPIYGSARLGLDNTPVELIGYTAPTDGVTTHVLGLKQYEFSNHLGNVLTTVSDKKVPNVPNGPIDFFVADITTSSDYYPFGSPMDGRTYSGEKYRFGFNGKENDNEIQGNGNSYDFGARIYDSRLGIFLSIDPRTKERAWMSPYNFCQDNPIFRIDPTGELDELVITGSTPEEGKKVLQKGTTMILEMNPETGAITTTSDPVTEYDKRLKEVMDAPDVKVDLVTVTSNTFPNPTGSYTMFGGAFFGNKIEQKEGVWETPVVGPVNYIYNVAVATQVIYPAELTRLDAYFGYKGQFILHEITEAYIGGLIALRNNEPTPKASGGNPVYDKAHKGATSQPDFTAEDYQKAEDCSKKFREYMERFKIIGIKIL